MTVTVDFYAKLPSFRDFNEVTLKNHFHEAPEDWVLIISDIKGSTKAIQEGRYREVNMVGASVFTAVLNALPGLEFPFVFGGDGATLLLPPSAVDKAIEALQGTQKMALEMFAFDLRVGVVALSGLYKDGIKLEIAKYEVSTGNSLAMFQGGALTKAEALVKASSPLARIIVPDVNTKSPNLAGLSCRWEPFATQKGLVLTLLVQSRGAGNTERATYTRVIQEINDILGHDLNMANPISFANMKEKLIASDLNIEIRMNSQPGFKNFLTTLRFIFKSCLNYIFIEKDLRVGNFQGSKYKQEMITNADHKKFDEMLRMVLDCTEAQSQQICEALEKLYQEKEIYYGVHKSSGALMTCLVTALQEGKHLHFVDGANGGYALAAIQLKAQK